MILLVPWLYNNKTNLKDFIINLPTNPISLIPILSLETVPTSEYDQIKIKFSQLINK